MAANTYSTVSVPLLQTLVYLTHVNYDDTENLSSQPEVVSVFSFNFHR